MLTLKLQYQDSETVARMKTSYTEITYLDLCGLLKNSMIEDETERLYENIALLGGIDIGIARQFDLTTSLCIVPFLGWIDEISLLPVYECKHKVQIGAEAWGKFEHAKALLKYDNQYEVSLSIIEAIKIYRPRLDISTMPALEGLAIAKWFEQQFVDFFTKFQRLNDYQPKGDQILAGIEELGRFGFLNTLHALCNGNPLKYDAMLEQSADVVYSTLVYDFELSQYRERLTEIQSKKK